MGEAAWKHWKARTYGEVNLCDGTYKEIKGALLSFLKDVGQLYPSWDVLLGSMSVSSVRAASFGRERNGASAAGMLVYFVGPEAKVMKNAYPKLLFEWYTQSGCVHL